MPLFTIDETACRKDGLCAADCPANIIQFNADGDYPAPVQGAETICLKCGHCVAACPHGALDHAWVPLDESPAIEKELRISTDQAIQFLRSRRSVRRFKEQAVPRPLLQQLLETARYAPTGSNGQLVEYIVIDDPDHLHQLSENAVNWMRMLLKADSQAKAMPYLPRLLAAWDAGIDTVLWRAPCLVVAMAPAHDRSGMVNLSLALSYLELTAPLHGIGTCWAGLLQGAIMASPELKKMVGIPKAYPHHYPMMLGYAAVRYHRLPQHKAPVIHWS